MIHYNRTTITEEPISDLPDECQQCGCNCSKAERAICLAEMDGV
jgi:hypothetical protein